MMDWLSSNWHLCLLGALVLVAIIILIVKRKKKKNPEKRLVEWITKEKETGTSDEECYQRLVKYNSEWANPNSKAIFYQALAEIDKQPKEKSPKETKGSKNPKNSWRTIAIVFIVVVALIGLGFGYLTYEGYFQSSVNQNQNVTCGECPACNCPNVDCGSGGQTTVESNINFDSDFIDDYCDKKIAEMNCT